MKFLPLKPEVAQVVAACVLALIALAGYGFWKFSDRPPVKPELEVQQSLLGVWTHTQPVEQDREPYGWERWTFAASEVQIQSARPSDTVWGKPSSYRYEIKREKTSDTGEWYWRVRLLDSAMNAAWMGNKRHLTVFRLGATNNYDLKKQDKDLSK